MIDSVFDFTSNELLPDFLEIPNKIKKIPGEDVLLSGGHARGN